MAAPDISLRKAWCKVAEWCANIPWLTEAQIQALIDATQDPEPPLVRVFEGEDSGTTDTARYNMSQGNGNEHTALASAFGWGTVLPAAFEVEVVTIGARINPADGSTYQLTKSVGGAANALVGSPMALAGNTLADVFPQPVQFAAGDVLNVWTIEGGATDAVVNVWGRWL